MKKCRWQHMARRGLLGLLCAVVLFASFLPASAHFSFLISHSSFPADTVRRVASQPILHVDEDEEIPDSLLHPRWKIQKTAPVEVSEGMYVIGSKIGDNYLNAPVLMTPEEYRAWSEKRELQRFFRKKDAENVQNKRYSVLVACASRHKERQS